MHSRSTIAGMLALLLGAACQTAPTASEFRLDVITTSSAPDDALNFNAHLTGAEEVPPRDTPAQGQALFHLSADGTTLSYRVTVANISNVVQAHIHIGAPGANGPFVVFLFGPVAAGGGRVNGVLASGSFTAADFVNTLVGLAMSDLLAEIRAGNTYVNVHTSDGSATPGPGNFPGGEIRGQIGGGHVNH